MVSEVSIENKTKTRRKKNQTLSVHEHTNKYIQNERNQRSRRNGLAEKTVQTVKTILEKAKRDGKDPYLAILEQCNTPVDNYKSPAQLSMGRRLRSILPSTTNHLLPETPRNTEKTSQKQEQQKAYHDRSAIALPLLKTGEQVRFHRDDEWEPARIIEVSNTHRSYILETPDGAVYRRNRVHLHNDKSAPAQQPAITAEPTSNEQKVAKDADNPPEAPSMNQKLPHPSGTSDGYHTRYGRLVKRPKRFDE